METMPDLLDIAGAPHLTAAAYYQALRRWSGDRPIFFDSGLNGLVATSHACCAAILRGEAFVKANLFAAEPPADPIAEVEQMMRSHFGAEGGERAALRRRYWARRMQRPDEAELRGIAAALLGGVGSGRCDLNRDVLRPYVRRAALRACGLAQESTELADALDTYVGHLDGRLDGVPQLAVYRAYLSLLGQLSAMLPFPGAAARDDGYDTAEQWAADAAFVLAAAQESTAFLVGSILLAAGAWHGAAPDRLIAEALRFDSPVQLVARHAQQDAVVAGIPVPAGTRVFCHIGLANRDGEVFADPDRFDPARGNASAALAFGAGRWICIGQALARDEARVMLEILAELDTRLQLFSDSVRYARASAAREFAALPCLLAYQ